MPNKIPVCSEPQDAQELLDFITIVLEEVYDNVYEMRTMVEAIVRAEKFILDNK